ncbi:MAG: aldo/keto reductase [Deltaproteobacteria bacterium]|nr:aldo/keto reductase [Deltaproteobacteria bacterium]
MKYRQFGKLDWKVSALSFGAMRLPVIDNDQSKIDEEEAIGMIRYAFDHGVNYIDTAFPYHMGNSEYVVAKALKDGYREKVKLATKLPPTEVKKTADFEKLLDHQLKKLDTDHIDFYLMHGIGKDRWEHLSNLKIMNEAEKALSDGRIHHLGFSFHDDLDAFKEIVDGYDNWTMCQIQYNYMDIEFQAGTEGLKYAADKGLAVVVMEPLRGGVLAKEPPESVKKLWASTPAQYSPPAWALRWVWNQPEVSTVLSGMSTMRQVEENVASAEMSEPGNLSNEELSLIGQVREEYYKISPIACTACEYCMPCPNEVNIPDVFKFYNEGYIYDDHRIARFRYRQLLPEQQASNCEACLECEEQCPQELPISEWMGKVHAWLGPKPK